MGFLATFASRALANPQNVLIRVGRTLYWGSAAVIVTAWYSSWRNQRVAPGSITEWPVPGLTSKAAQYPPAREDAPLPAAGTFSGGAASAPSGGTGLSAPPGGLGANVPNLIALGNLGKSRFGLTPTENPHFGGVHPVHASNSLHYQGRAIDFVGPEGNMRAFGQYLVQHYGKHITELIHNPGYSVKNGKQVPPSFWGAAVWGQHKNHLHLGI